MTEPSLRRCIHRIRSRLAAAFAANAGLPLSANALIENAPLEGISAQPAVLILAPGEILPVGRASRLPEPDVTTRQRCISRKQ